MKVSLFEIETHFAPAAIEDAMELVKDTHEYDLTQPEEGYYHCISRQPDYHVEITLHPEGLAVAKCHCTVFRRTKHCRHVIAALLLLRDHLSRSRRSRSKSKHENDLLQEVLQKLRVSDLKSFITAFAKSHGAFRAEILAQYLHLTRKPDYQALLMDITPMDRYGVMKLNRNNLKTVRNIISTLLRQAHELLKEKALAETLHILEATLQHLYRLIIKVPQFQEQLSTELRQALRLFETLCRQPMAPRLQQTAIQLAIQISSRDGYTFLKGTTPLLHSVEPFILETKTRQSVFQLASKKILDNREHALPWACFLIRWHRLWDLVPAGKEIKLILKERLPDIIYTFNLQGEHEDACFAIQLLQRKEYPARVLKPTLQAGLRSARQIGNQKLVITLAYDLSLLFLDRDAWDILYDSDAAQALRSLEVLEEFYPPGTDGDADHFLLHGWHNAGNENALLLRLIAIGDMELVMRYDHGLMESCRATLIDLYAGHIHAIREAYGGVQARQKLSNIFGHLKMTGLYMPVMDKIKLMDQNTRPSGTPPSTPIKGFVFDLDGVLVDTAVHHFQSWKIVMKELGVDIRDEDDEHTRGASRMESLEYLLQQYHISITPEEKELWAAKKNDLYIQSIEQITPMDLLPGVMEFLMASRKAGLLLALGSASKNARGVLKKLQIDDRFDAILDGHDAKESKPHPEIFIKAAGALNLNPAEVVVFEDAAKGVQAAVAAGCRVVGIGSPEILRSADIVIAGLDETSPANIIERLS